MTDVSAHIHLHQRQLDLMGRLLPRHPARLRALEESVYPGYRFPWRVAEAPALVSPELFARDLAVQRELLAPYATESFRARYQDPVPHRFRRPDDSGWFPRFVATDYQRVWNAEARVFTWCVPEIQSFPGNLFLKPAMLRACLPSLPGSKEGDAFLGDRFPSHDDYVAFLRSHILGNHAPEDTIVLEVNPREQKTVVDMLLTIKHLGCRLVDLRDVTVDPLTHEATYVEATVFDGPAPRQVRYPTSQVARNILSRCVPEELDMELDDRASPVTLAFMDALLRDTLAHGTAAWVVHPQDFFVLAKAALVGNPHHHPPLRPLTLDLLDELDRAGCPLDRGVIKPAYTAGGRGLLGFTGSIDRAELERTLRDRAAGGGNDPMDILLWQEKYGADLFDRSHIRGFDPRSDDEGGPVYHELRIMWAARAGTGSSVDLTPLCGLTRWSRRGVPASAGNQSTPFTGTNGVLVADLEPLTDLSR